MSKFAIGFTTPDHDIDVTMYDRTTRRIRPYRGKVSSLIAIIDQRDNANGDGVLVGDFVDMVGTHYVAKDADTSPFVVDPESAMQFLLPMKDAPAGAYVPDRPLLDEQHLLTHEWLNNGASHYIESYYPVGKQLTVDRVGTTAAKAEMHAYIDAVLAVANKYEGLPAETDVPWPDPPASRIGKES